MDDANDRDGGAAEGEEDEEEKAKKSGLEKTIIVRYPKDIGCTG